MKAMKKIFLSGVIQGSSLDKSIHSQDYRTELKDMLTRVFPDVNIYDPFHGHESSVEYDDDKGRATFLGHLKEIYDSDLLVAYLPHASLGTAIEIWESHQRGIPVWTISPMKTNWVVRFCSNKIFEDIKSFADYLAQQYVISDMGK
jgi:hypothetical protein